MEAHLDECSSSGPIIRAEGNDTNAEYSPVLDARDALIRLYQKNPNAPYTTQSFGKRTMRQVLSDDAQNLQTCDARLASDLDRVVTTGLIRIPDRA